MFRARGRSRVVRGREPRRGPAGARRSPMSAFSTGLNVSAVRCEALFASQVQESDHPTSRDVRDAVRQAVRELGCRGCAARVAQEFGDHPDTAIARMQWAHRMIQSTFGDGSRAFYAPRTWRLAPCILA